MDTCPRKQGAPLDHPGVTAAGCSAGPAEKHAIVQELVHSITVNADRDEAGRPVYHYDRRTRPDGSFWYAHRVPHVSIHVVYAFGEQDSPANKDSEVLAHGQRFIAMTSRNE